MLMSALWSVMLIIAWAVALAGPWVARKLSPFDYRYMRPQLYLPNAVRAGRVVIQTAGDQPVDAEPAKEVERPRQQNASLAQGLLFCATLVGVVASFFIVRGAFDIEYRLAFVWFFIGVMVFLFKYGGDGKPTSTDFEDLLHYFKDGFLWPTTLPTAAILADNILPGVSEPFRDSIPTPETTPEAMINLLNILCIAI